MINLNYSDGDSSRFLSNNKHSKPMLGKVKLPAIEGYVEIMS